MTTVTTEITINFKDLDSIAEAIGLGITTPEQIAQHIGVELTEDGVLALEDCPMYADDGTAEAEYDSEMSHKNAAKEYVNESDYDRDGETSWVTINTYKKGVNDRGEVVQVDCERHKIAIEPEEPDCIDDEHIWKSPFSILGGLKENPGVQGHGGGVVISEVCMICGCKKTTDTWAQDMTDGEQGLTSISYSESEYAEEVDALNLNLAKSHLDTNTPQSGEHDFEWKDEDGDIVGADDDELIEFGQQLRRNPNKKIIGILLSSYYNK